MAAVWILRNKTNKICFTCQENNHAMLICKRERIDRKATKKTSLVRQQSMAGEMRSVM